MSCEVCYISSACNQTPTIAHWGKNNFICYGSCNSVMIFDHTFGSGGKVLKTLCGHTNRVNSVRWISGIDSETELVSGGTDGNVIVWSRNAENYSPFVLKGHIDIVNIVDGLYKNNSTKLAVVVSASVDSTVKVWTRANENDEFIQTQNIQFGYHISTALNLTFLPECSILVLACAMDDSNIQLYIENETERKNDPISFVESEVLKGHENWIRGLDFTLDDTGDLILASASQDALIRLWRISRVNVTPLENGTKETEIERNSMKKYDLILNKRKIKTSIAEYLVSLESILSGHEGWIYSVSWCPKSLKLLSASLDKSMIIWEYDSYAGLWLEKVRVGEVGGNTLGFYGGMFGPDGSSILAHGYHGAFHIWNFSEKTDMWTPAVTVGGHFDEVTDIAWEPQGEFLVSISKDQTTRVHAPWHNRDKEMTWHEIARPQVHGYDLSCLAVLSRYSFASGAEEKVVRTFKAPKNFVENFRRICQIQNDGEGDELASVNNEEAKGASVPSLGLSNKAVYADDNTDLAKAKSSKEPYPEESYFTAVLLTEPPTEETLLQNTLWPEVQKLYGHGYELYSLAATADGKLLASACKATTLEHAAILLWDTTTWTQIQKLLAHTLTIVQLAFSPDCNSLLSVSRDRRWSVFSRNADTGLFELVATSNKNNGIHTRIIWCCAWSHDSKYFATGSRDGKVVVWHKNCDKSSEYCLGQFKSVGQFLELKGESVTAVTFASCVVDGCYLLAIGLESGLIFLYKWSCEGWGNVLRLQNSDAHHLAVRRLMFRPTVGGAGDNTANKVFHLASCGSDHAVKLYHICF